MTKTKNLSFLSLCIRKNTFCKIVTPFFHMEEVKWANEDKKFIKKTYWNKDTNKNNKINT